MKLVLSAGNHETPLEGPDPITLGSAPSCTLVLEDASVAAVHARVERRAEGWLLVDQGAAPTAVGGVVVRAGRGRLIRAGDELRLGEIAVVVRAEADAALPTHELALAALGGSAMGDLASVPAVCVVEGPGLGTWVLLEGDGPVYVVGRGEDAALRVDDPSVSRHHVNVWREGDSVRVRDRGSAHGSWLGETRLQPHRAAAWSAPTMLRVGDCVLAIAPPMEERLDALLGGAAGAARGPVASIPPQQVPEGSLAEELAGVVPGQGPAAPVVSPPEPVAGDARAPTAGGRAVPLALGTVVVLAVAALAWLLLAGR